MVESPANSGAFVFYNGVMTRLVKLISIALLVSFACAKSEQPVLHRVAHPFARKRAPKPKVQEPGEVSLGSMMPPYQTPSLDGKQFDLAAQKGTVVLLNLWATWCQPCRFEIPELEKMQKEYSSRGLKVVGVSLDDTGVDGVKAFVKEQKMTYPIALDPEGKIANMLQTSILPTTVLIDKSGKIVWKQYGAVSSNDESLQKALTAALASS